MRATISQRELRNDSGAIMRRVEQGESFTVTRNGVPIADLLPHNASTAGRAQRFVPVSDIAAGVAALPSGGSELFRGELAELDDSGTILGEFALVLIAAADVCAATVSNGRRQPSAGPSSVAMSVRICT